MVHRDRDASTRPPPASAEEVLHKLDHQAAISSGAAYSNREFLSDEVEDSSGTGALFDHL